MIDAIVTLIVGAALTVWVARRPSRAGAVLLVAVAVWWLIVDTAMEGPVLISFTDAHGLVLSDLGSVIAAAVAARAWVQPQAQRGRRSPTSRSWFQRSARDSHGRRVSR